jgi:hypothetical protein
MQITTESRRAALQAGYTEAEIHSFEKQAAAAQRRKDRKKALRDLLSGNGDAAPKKISRAA